MYKINRKISIRIEVLSKYISGVYKRKDAANILEVSERQLSRLVTRFRKEGPRGLFHRNCGKIPPNKVAEEIINLILKLYRTKYISFNIRHFWEKLDEELGIHRPSYATVRRILIENGLIYLRKKRSHKNRKERKRYEREGIMVQIDGSHHQWFGNDKSCLIAAVDDATGKILSAKFSPSETTFATMDVIEDVITTYGKFHVLYSDKAGIYDNHKREGFSQLTRCLYELGIQTIFAHSPQAKGRVERLFRTLQDRLISELRLKNIQTIDQANLYLQYYIEVFNKQFSVRPESASNAFEKIDNQIKVSDLFYLIEYRKVNSSSTFLYNSKRCLITTEVPFSLNKQSVEIRIFRDKRIQYFVKGVQVEITIYKKMEKAS